MADPREKALHKHVRIAPEQWERLEQAAHGTPHSPNQILVELAMEALDHRGSKCASRGPRCSPLRPPPSLSANITETPAPLGITVGRWR